MKKHVLNLVLLIVYAYHCSGQTGATKAGIVPAKYMIGTWQYSTKNIGAGLLENFRFLDNNHFIYCFEPTSANRKFSEIKGTYKITGDELRLIVTSYTEITGGEIVSGGFGSSTDLFEIYKSIPKQIIPKQSIVLDPLFFSRLDLKNGSIMINSKKFFKISSKSIQE